MNSIKHKTFKIYVPVVITKSMYQNLMTRLNFSEKIVSVKLLAIVIIDFKPYTSTYGSMQGCCVICSKIQNLERKKPYKIRITTFNHFYIVTVHTWF